MSRMASLFSWGLSSNGQLGLGNLEEEYVVRPRAMGNLRSEDVKHISCGFRHCLILMRGGNVYSCGANDFGQLGVSAMQFGNKVTSPTQISALETQQISIVCCGGDDFSVAVNARGQVFSWGKNTYGQTGRPNPEVGPKQVPIKLIRQLVNHRVVGVACGKWHTLAYTSDSLLFAWGSNSDGQLGLGDQDVDCVDRPHQIRALSHLPIRQVSAGGRHSFCLSVSRVLFGWGCNDDGQLGLGDTVRRSSPRQLESLRALRVAEVACGEKHTAVLTLSGALFTFGDGTYGQLGHGHFSTRHLLPKQVTELMGSSVNQVACGRLHTLVLVSSACKLFCFGHGAFGQLGVGHVDDRALPVPVKGSWVEFGSRLELHWAAAGGSASFVFGRPCDKAAPPGQRDLHAVCIATLGEERTGAGLEAVLGSLPCLVASFPDDEDAGRLGVDLDEVAAVTEALMESCAAEERLQHVRRGLERLVDEVWTRRSFVEEECLRVCLILPVSAFFSRPRVFGRVVCRFCRFVIWLDDAGHRTVMTWFSRLLPRHMKRMVLALQKCLRMLWEMDDDTLMREFTVDQESPRITVLKMLALLYRANTSPQIVQNDTFHFPDLTRYVDIAHDYAHFLRSNLCARWGEDGLRNNFYCNFPFIYDGFGKKRLMEAAFGIEKQINAHASDDFVCIWRVRRSHIIDDTLAQLEGMSPVDIKKQLRVEFENEEGIDEGGLTKEYFLLLFREILDPQYGMFKFYSESRMIWFKPATFEDVDMFCMIGKICGLAVYNFTLVNLNFPLALFKKLLGGTPTLDDLKELDPVVGRSLQELLDYDGAEPIEEVFCLKFEITKELVGHHELVELCKHGSEKSVSLRNREEYVSLYVDYVFNKSCEDKFEAFSDGFNQACSSKVLSLFEPKELLAVVEGSENYDWDLLKETVQYEGVFTENHLSIVWFWEVFQEMAESDKKRFLLFLTGSDRVPLVGMSGIELIFNSCNRGDESYPVAHTCSSALDLPMHYSSKEVLRDRLLVAIQCEGFGLV